VVPDVSTEEIRHSVAIVLGIAGDALKRVHASDPDVDDIAADLVDGSGEPLGDLTFSADVHLPPARYRSTQHNESCETLQDRSPHVVRKLCLGLLELDAFGDSCNGGELGSAETGIEELWQ
jgi:hypothetical protein